MKRHARVFVAALFLVVWIASLRAEDGFFDSDGVKIAYTVVGEGEPVILIHGFAANRQMQWDAPGITSRLAKDYRVIEYDNRGHGKSDKPHAADAYGIQMVEDVVRLMDHFKIEKAHVVGYSMGGFITDKLLTTHPDRVLSATLGGAGWARADDTTLGLLDQLATSLETGQGIGPLITYLNPPGRPKPTEAEIKAVNQMLSLTNDFKALGAVARGMQDFAVPEEALKQNKVPTLALIGSIDPLKAGVDALDGEMSDLTIHVIDGADHMDAFRKPEFIDTLSGFLEAHSLQPAAAAGGGGGK